MTKPNKAPKVRRPGIPGTVTALNERVQDVLTNHVLSPAERGDVAASLITEKVLLAYRLSE